MSRAWSDTVADVHWLDPRAHEEARQPTEERGDAGVQHDPDKKPQDRRDRDDRKGEQGVHGEGKRGAHGSADQGSDQAHKQVRVVAKQGARRDNNQTRQAEANAHQGEEGAEEQHAEGFKGGAHGSGRFGGFGGWPVRGEIPVQVGQRGKPGIRDVFVDEFGNPGVAHPRFIGDALPVAATFLQRLANLDV